jgi:hypothetical protein
MAEQNIANVSTIYGRTVRVSGVGNVENTRLTCGTNQIVKINTVIATNRALTNAAVSLRYGTDAFIAYNITIPPGSSIALVGKDTPIYLMESHQLKAAAGLGTVDLIISYEVILTS